jgi:hypothetical protein
MSGKGSTPRPLSIPRKQFDKNWEQIFGNKSKDKKEHSKNKETK